MCGGELLGRKGMGQGGEPTYPLPLKKGASWGPLSSPCPVDFQGHLACLSPPGVGTWREDGVRVTKGLHSPPSSSTNVDEVVSQGSWEAHFLFRPQDFPRQAPP